MRLRRTALPSALTALLVGGFLLAPTPAGAELDQNSVTTAAEIVAEAFDGAGETAPDRDRAGRIGFSEFLRTVNARDRNRDSGRGAKANVTQDTRLVEDSDLVLGVDTSGDADSSYTDPNPGDSLKPFGSGTSELDVGFEVVNAPVQFVLTGSIEASVSGEGAGSAKVTVTDPTGAETVAEVGSFDSGTDAIDLDLTNTISPGSHDFEVDIDVFSGSNTAVPLSVGTATADYDLELRFCTHVVDQPNLAVIGSSGDDVICGRSGNDDIFAGRGDDGPGSPSVENVVAGGPGNDTIDGGPGDDRILGRCGESLFGEPSPVCPDDPPAPGESDHDKLVGKSGADIILGDADRDSILAGKGDDLVEGLGGPDFIAGGPGDDSLDGGEGNDEILGEAGKDALFGADGKDCLDGGAKKDKFFGGAGDDKLLARDGGRDTGSGGPGPDRGRFDAADRIASVAIRSFQGGC